MKFKKSKGLTLLEVIISLAILGIIIAPILTMTLTTVKISKSSEAKIFATSLAQQCTEYLKSAVVINESFLDSLQLDVGLEGVSTLENTEDDENLKVLKNNFKDEGIKKIYLYNGTDKEKYKNIITTIEYKTISNTATDEYSDIKNYNMLIDVADTIAIKSIMDNSINQLYNSGILDESKGYIEVKIENTSNKFICSIKQGDTELCSNREVPKQNEGDGKIKFILKGNKEIDFNIRVENKALSNVFNIDFLKEINSRYTYSMLTGDSSNIKTNYKTFDKSANTPEKLVRKNTFKIQIWNCDFKNKTKNLLQEIETTKAM